VNATRLDTAIAGFDYVDEIAPTKKAALAKRGVAVDTDVLGERAVRGLAYHRDFAAPIRGRHSLLAFLSLRGQPLGGLMLGRCGGRFSEADIQLVEALLPRLSVARLSFRVPWDGGLLSHPERSIGSRIGALVRGQSVLEVASERPAGAIVVRDKAGFREMVSVRDHDEFVWSRASLREPERSGWFYIDLFHLALTRAKAQRRVLFIGSGGGVAVRQFARVYPGVRIDLVESDAQVIDLASRWFDLHRVPNLSIVIDDGAAFAERALSSTWDAVIVDAYDGPVMSTAFASRAFFANVRRVVRPGGGLALNLIGSLGGGGALQAIEQVARAELGDVRLVPVLDPGEAYSPMALRNVVLLGRR
jgi:SAM-dependent methyltransferase